MPKTKVAPLSDWQVNFTESLAGRTSVTVRATCLRTPAGWVFLDDASGDHLLAVPAQNVAYVRRLEPGQEAPAEEAPMAEAVASEKVTPPSVRSKRSGARS